MDGKIFSKLGTIVRCNDLQVSCPNNDGHKGPKPTALQKLYVLKINSLERTPSVPRRVPATLMTTVMIKIIVIVDGQ